MSRRNFLVKFILWILTFFFGYRVGNTESTIIIDKDGSLISEKIEILNKEVAETTKFFNSLDDMKLATNLRSGDSVQTLGYYSKNDGGGASYLVQTSNLKENGGSVITLKNGLQAVLVYTDFIDVQWFGAKGDNKSDDSSKIQTLLNYCNDTSRHIKIHFQDSKTFIIGTLLHPADNTIFKIPGNVSLTGKGVLKIKDGFGNFRYMFKLVTKAENVVIRDLTIDENTIGNPKTDANTRKNRRTLFSYWVDNSKNVLFSNVVMKDCIGVHQITTSSIDRLEIIGCQVEMSVEKVPAYDRTSFYVGGQGAIVRDNFLYGSRNAVTGIELHNSDTRCHNNIIKNYTNGVFIVADNTLAGAPSPYRNVMFFNNILEDVALGVTLWTELSINLENIKIMDNIIKISPSRGGLSKVLKSHWGIGTLPNWAATSIRDVHISGNTIEFNINSKEVPNTVSHGITFAALTEGVKYIIDNIKIEKNSIVNPINTGINFEFLNSSHADSVVKNVDISQNYIENPGQLGKSGYGIRMTNVRKFENVTIENNNVSDVRKSGGMISGIAYFKKGLITEDSASTGLRLIKNEIKKPNVTGTYTQIIADGYPRVDGYVYQRSAKLVLKAAVGSMLYDPETGVTYRQTKSPEGTIWASSYNASVARRDVYHYLGSIITNPTPVAGGYVGLVCIEEGKPGGWKGYGVIQS